MYKIEIGNKTGKNESLSVTEQKIFTLFSEN